MKLEVKHLRHFNDALKRDVIADLMTRRDHVPDRVLLDRIVAYGNAFLEAERVKPENRNAVIWFDCHFGEPAVIGLSWALNPHAPTDQLYGAEFFWRCWSEVSVVDDPAVVPLVRCQHELASYVMAHVSVG